MSFVANSSFVVVPVEVGAEVAFLRLFLFLAVAFEIALIVLVSQVVLVV